jgi:hypothetical protein
MTIENHGAPAFVTGSPGQPAKEQAGMSTDLRQEQFEHAVLRVIELHPDHLTRAELICEMTFDPPARSDEKEIGQAIRDLRRSGLLRENGDALVPTRAALRAHAVFAEG